MSAIEVLEGLKRKVNIKLDANEVASEKEKRLKDLAKRIRVDGFRPGKVPTKVVERMHGQQIESDVINDKINAAFSEIIKGTEIKPAGYPMVVPNEGTDQFDFAVEFEVMPEITLSFDKLDVKKVVAEVTASDVDEMVETLRKQQAKWNEKAGAAEDGDKVVIDFVGRIEGEEFDGGKGTDVPLVLGSKSMIPGFEDGIVGVKAGEKKTIKVTFPEDYNAENLKGKAAEFDITVHKVESPILPEVDAEFAKGFGIEDGSVDKLKEELEKNMVRELKNVLNNQLKTNMMAALAEANPIDVPEALVMGEVQAMAQQSNFPQPKDQEQAQQFLKIAQQAFGPEAERRARLGLLLSELVKSNDIKLDDKFVEARLENLAATYEDPEEVKAHFRKDQNTMQQVRNLALEDQIVEFLTGKAKITEEKSNFKDVMQPKKA